MIPSFLRNVIDYGELKESAYKQYAVLTQCDKCRRKVFTVRCDYPYGYDRKLDPEPLNTMGEAFALSADIPTYVMYGYTATALRFDGRITWDIINSPAGKVLPSGNVVYVVMEHRCWMNMPPQFREDWVGNGESSDTEAVGTRP